MDHEAAGPASTAVSSIFDPALPGAADTVAGTGTPHARRRTRRAPNVSRDVTDEVLTARQRRQARHSLELSSLLNERAELRGVYAPADLVAEALSWSA